MKFYFEEQLARIQMLVIHTQFQFSASAIQLIYDKKR